MTLVCGYRGEATSYQLPAKSNNKGLQFLIQHKYTTLVFLIICYISNVILEMAF